MDHVAAALVRFRRSQRMACSTEFDLLRDLQALPVIDWRPQLSNVSRTCGRLFFSCVLRGLPLLRRDWCVLSGVYSGAAQPYVSGGGRWMITTLERSPGQRAVGVYPEVAKPMKGGVCVKEGPMLCSLGVSGRLTEIKMNVLN